MPMEWSVWLLPHTHTDTLHVVHSIVLTVLTVLLSPRTRCSASICHACHVVVPYLTFPYLPRQAGRQDEKRNL
jgi:hypothetical protein